MKYLKNPFSKRIKVKTPETDKLLKKVQSENMPFSAAFYQLLELARSLEREVHRLKSLDRRSKDEGNLVAE